MLTCAKEEERRDRGRETGNAKAKGKKWKKKKDTTKKHKAVAAHVDMRGGRSFCACRHARRNRNNETQEGQQETQKLKVRNVANVLSYSNISFRCILALHTDDRFK
jgi:hypothetical protein